MIKGPFGENVRSLPHTLVKNKSLEGPIFKVKKKRRKYFNFKVK